MFSRDSMNFSLTVSVFLVALCIVFKRRDEKVMKKNKNPFHHSSSKSYYKKLQKKHNTMYVVYSL